MKAHEPHVCSGGGFHKSNDFRAFVMISLTKIFEKVIERIATWPYQI